MTMLEFQVNTTESSVSSTDGFFIIKNVFFSVGINQIPWSTGRNIIECNSLSAQMSRECKAHRNIKIDAEGYPSSIGLTAGSECL